MPVWLHRTHPGLPYALPDIEGRGFKIAFDLHGEKFDPIPECGPSRRHPSTICARTCVSIFRVLENAPVLETRVCQYENTWNGDFLVDRHPDFENVWIAGGGSGHGFKHGPALGEYLSPANSAWRARLNRVFLFPQSRPRKIELYIKLDDASDIVCRRLLCGLSEFSEVVIIKHVPYAQSLQRSHRSCTYVTHQNWPGSSVGRAQP